MTADMETVREQMMPVAADLICRVRDLDAGGVAAALLPRTTVELHALAVVLAAMVPDDRQMSDLLSWVDGSAKRCCACGEELPLDQFTADRSRRDGLRPECRTCNAIRRRRRAYAAANPAA